MLNTATNSSTINTVGDIAKQQSKASPRKKHVNKWLKQRFPTTTEMTLNLRTIFIIPTATSIALLTTILLLFLMATNFQNALIYGLSFWLLALLVIAIFFTYRNLSGLTIQYIQSTPCFVGEKAVFDLQISCPQKQQKSAIFIAWKDEDIAEINLQNTHTQRVKISHSTSKRGRFSPSRISIFSRYPIGLIIAWSYADLDMHTLVYPEPRLQDSVDGRDNMDQEAFQGLEINNGSTDFSGIREYQAGDSPRHIHWGTYAKTGKVYTKSFVDYVSDDLWLDWDALDFQGVENKLSHLCARILFCHQEQLSYGLKIPDKSIPPASGEPHKNKCLSALALYGISDKES